MKRCATIVFALLFLCLGTIFADDIHDPIIDIEKGTGTIPFTGVFTLTVNDSSANCQSFEGSETVDTCGITNPFTISTGVLGNATGQDITSLDFLFTPSSSAVTTEGVFSSFANSPFQTVDQISGFEAIYSGGVITHNCVVGDGIRCDLGSEFNINFAEVLVPVGGFTDVRITSVAPVPEPPASALMLGGLSLLWIGRRWLH